MLNAEQKLQLSSHGYCIVPNVLDSQHLQLARVAFDSAVKATIAEGNSTHDNRLDPNEHNVRVYSLPEHSPLFADLLFHPTAFDGVKATLGEHFIISNFTANNALPGAEPMRSHSDQALSVPAPWLQAWTVNIIWCLDDIDEENGATHYLPDSHLITDFNEVPNEMENQMRSFEASAGSIVVMDGRLWHSSGKNLSANRQRRLCFGYYCCDFIRQQTNWEAALSAKTKEHLSEVRRHYFGLGAAGNTRLGGQYVRID